MKSLLLINLGTPDFATIPAVRRYLRQFLSDPKVIDINPIGRFLLLNLIILPFRTPKSTEAYQKIWMNEGSPLLFHTKNLAEKVAKKLEGKMIVEMAMRYGSPSIESALMRLLKKGAAEIQVLPLFPQYAVSSTGSALTEVFRVAQKLWHTPPIKVLPDFFSHPSFIKGLVQNAQKHFEQHKPDHLLFSFHGLPERQIKKTDLSSAHCLEKASCCDRMSEKNRFCYRAQCYETARKTAEGLGLVPQDYTICFQSRLGRTPWIKPYTDLELPELIKNGKKRFAVICPSFVADCLETLEEIGIRLKETALSLGAESLELIPCLNEDDLMVETIINLI